jgi:hypothetical protein
MFLTYPHLQDLTVNDIDKYNHFYFLHGVPCSDYCFSVIQTWLDIGGPVKVSLLNKGLILLQYRDVLDNNEPQKSYTIIGASSSVDRKVIDILCDLSKDKTNKIIITQPHKDKVASLLNDNWSLTEDIGLDDYLYSVNDYVDLSKPAYRRIRREIKIFQRTYGVEPILKQVDFRDINVRTQVINSHHSWDDTFKYNNDPDRVEGLVIAKMVELAPKMKVSCIFILVKENVEGLLIFTKLPMKKASYINLHHARFSYNYKFLNDYTFHLLSEYLKKDGVDYINFERDADIPGLRKHKELLKPVRMISNYSMVYNEK